MKMSTEKPTIALNAERLISEVCVLVELEIDPLKDHFY
jgi:hypothetical protein